MKLSKFIELMEFLKENKIFVADFDIRKLMSLSDEEINLILNVFKFDFNTNIHNLVCFIDSKMYADLKNKRIETICEIVNSKNFDFIFNNYANIKQFDDGIFDFNYVNSSLLSQKFTKYSELNILFEILIDAVNPSDTFYLASMMKYEEAIIDTYLLRKVSKQKSNELIKTICINYQKRNTYNDLLEDRRKFDFIFNNVKNKENIIKLIPYIQDEIDFESLKKIANDDKKNIDLLARIISEYYNNCITNLDVNDYIDHIAGRKINEENNIAINEIFNFFCEQKLLFTNKERFNEFLDVILDVKHPLIWKDNYIWIELINEFLNKTISYENESLRMEYADFMRIDNHPNFNYQTAEILFNLLQNYNANINKFVDVVIDMLDHYKKYEKLDNIDDYMDDKVVEALKRHLQKCGDIDLKRDIYLEFSDNDVIKNQEMVNYENKK